MNTYQSTSFPVLRFKGFSPIFDADAPTFIAPAKGQNCQTFIKFVAVAIKEPGEQDRQISR